MLSHQAVHDAQTFIAMTAHVNGDAQIELPAKIYFRRGQRQLRGDQLWHWGTLRY